LNRFALLAFLLALVLSAGLLFNIQPMVGKMLLPLVGGSSAVWNVAMAFFQISLLLGYLLAHALSRVPVRLHGLIYLALLGLAGLFLPIALPHNWQPDTALYVPGQVLTALFISVAVPFIALSLSAPTLQRLFTTSGGTQATDPYFLYAASNFGSFIGLLIYPLLLEPAFTLEQQAHFWRYGYALLVLLVVACVLCSNGRELVNTAVTSDQKPSARQRLWWVLLAFIPSSLTLGVTTYISTDISPTPMLWVLTLGLYLLTYVVAFAKYGEGLRNLNLATYQLLGCLAMALYTIRVDAHFLVMGIILAAFFVVALACHTLLARARPDASRLTEYYFLLSLGGALGGSFNAFIAPLIFPDYFEYPIVLLLGLLVYMPALTSKPVSRTRNVILVILITLVVLLMLLRDEIYEHTAILGPALVAVIIAVALLMLRRQRAIFAMALGGVFIGGVMVGYLEAPLFKDRSFFGVLRVNDHDYAKDGYSLRELAHGTTQHGAQIVRPTILTQPTTYYSVFSPVGVVMRVQQPVNVALIGLGAGSLNCYAKPTDRFTYIEIDPLVVQAAQTYFTFLSDCPAPRIIVGDGRLELAKLSELQDLIVIDAFSSDAIPVHLLTREAFSMYLNKLHPDGIIMIHISNRYFNLASMLASVAAELGLRAYQGINSGRLLNKHLVHFPSEWVMLSRRDNWLEKLNADQPPADKLGGDMVMQTASRLVLKTEWQPMSAQTTRVWTDSYSNLLSVLK
jgi:hypothetical protein